MSGKAVRETLGFLAVVAGMVFVGIEIRQNTVAQEAQTAAQRAQTRQGLADAGRDFTLMLGTDPEARRVWYAMWQPSVYGDSAVPQTDAVRHDPRQEPHVHTVCAA